MLFSRSSPYNFNPLPSCEGRPISVRWDAMAKCYFNPLPSCEGRPGLNLDGDERRLFQSTPLMRGETVTVNPYCIDQSISIHSPYARGDAAIGKPQPLIIYFNPLPSCKGRRALSPSMTDTHNFNPLPSCEGRRGAGAVQRDHQNFNPLPSREGRRDDRKSILDIINFNPLPSREGRQG